MAKRKNKVCTLAWKTSAGIEQAAALKKDLLTAFSESEEIHLDLSEVQDIDTSAFQIILAAKKEADEKKLRFFVVSPIPEHILKIATLLQIPLPTEKSAEANHA